MTLSQIPEDDRDIHCYIKTKPKKQEKILPFVTEFNPAIPNIKQILSKNWCLIENQQYILKKNLPTKTNYKLSHT